MNNRRTMLILLSLTVFAGGGRFWAKSYFENWSSSFADHKTRYVAIKELAADVQRRRESAVYGLGDSSVQSAIQEKAGTSSLGMVNAKPQGKNRNPDEGDFVLSVEFEDPAHGFTSSGLGVRLRNASFSGGVATFTAEVNNSLSPCDRFDASKKDDMNGAMKKADTWITVAYSVLFLPAGSTVTPGSGQHSLSYAEYGVAAPAVKQPALAERTVTIKGKPGASQALVGLQGFDFISNSSSKLVAGCTVKQLADCKGTGRYIRTVRARASLGSMDKTTGEAKVELDLIFANKTSSGMGAIEKGSMCVQASGDVVLIQLPDGARVSAGKKAELKEIKSGVQGEAAVDVCGVLPGGVDCP